MYRRTSIKNEEDIWQYIIFFTHFTLVMFSRLQGISSSSAVSKLAFPFLIFLCFARQFRILLSAIFKHFYTFEKRANILCFTLLTFLLFSLLCLCLFLFTCCCQAARLLFVYLDRCSILIDSTLCWMFSFLCRSVIILPLAGSWQCSEGGISYSIKFIYYYLNIINEIPRKVRSSAEYFIKLYEI